jgi:hypothetical protein
MSGPNACSPRVEKEKVVKYQVRKLMCASPSCDVSTLLSLPERMREKTREGISSDNLFSDNSLQGMKMSFDSHAPLKEKGQIQKRGKH